MTECDCKEPCEDCQHEETVDLDNISSLLFNEVNSGVEKESKGKKQEKKEVKVEKEEIEEKKDSKKKEKSKEIKKASRKVECEKREYKDPITEEYKLKFNNKIGRKVWGNKYGENCN